MTTLIKICGVTDPANAAEVAAAGADFIGLNFWPRSKRFVTRERAAELGAAIRSAGPARLVGVFVDARPDEIAAVFEHVELDIVQLHGDETPARLLAIAPGRSLWKVLAAGDATAVDDLDRWPADAILLDTPGPDRGGTGKTFDWSIARLARERHPARQIVLAGGLHPDNVAAAITEVSPWAVDVASGVESAPGIKDPARVTEFIAAARAARGRS
jgi:phosphoribosylanthranilate isomerase